MQTSSFATALVTNNTPGECVYLGHRHIGSPFAVLYTQPFSTEDAAPVFCCSLGFRNRWE